MGSTFTGTSYAGDTGAPSTIGCVGDSSPNRESSPFGARLVAVPVNFGISSSSARTTVASVPWVVGRPKPIAVVVGRAPQPDPSQPATEGSDEDVLTDGIRAIVTNITDGSSFDVIATCDNTSSGRFLVHVIGVGT